MKMVKSLLLGSAAGLVAVAGAQAADLPVKAKPVEYVKICTLYGEGYYYIPGSDTCLKFGGYARGDYGWNVANTTPAYSGTQGAQDRSVSRFSTRTRGNLQLDARTQTQYGTLRAFTSLHFDHVDGVNTNTLARAFIQWAGFTFGHAQSFQDTWGITDSWHYTQQQNNSDTGANGVNQIAYTWELGNGTTLTLGADAARRKSLANLSSPTAIRVSVEPQTAFGGQDWFDGFVALKINQAWGYWATSFVVHDVHASYNNGNITTGVCSGPLPAGTNAGAGLSGCGRPGDKLGWAAQTGAEFKMDMLSPGDRLGFGVRYAEGASGYGGGSNLATASLFGSGNEIAFGPMTDGVFVNGSGIQLTTTWTVMAGYEHQWTPTFKSSIAAGYTEVLYNATAKNMFATNVCATAASLGLNGVGGGTTMQTNCNPDWGFFQGGVRTQWNPSPGFFLGVDVMYTHVYTAFQGTTANVNGIGINGTGGITALVPAGQLTGGRQSGIYRFEDNGIWNVIFRAQRNFNSGD